MNQLEKLFNYEGHQVRTVIKNEEPWFVIADVCQILALSNPTESLRALDEDEKSTLRISEGGPERNIINEAGLYTLIIRSNKTEAKQFKRWITHEVLPSIRKTGSYQQPQSQLEILQSSINQLVEQEQKVKQIETQLTTVNHRLDNIDRIDTIGDLRQRLNAMVKRYAHQEGLTFSTAWKKFRNAFNTAYHTNLTNRVNHYKDKHGLKSLSIPLYLSLSNNLEDAIRVADKMLNQLSKGRRIQ